MSALWARALAAARAAWPALLSVLAPILFFHRAVFSEEIFISRDIQRVYYPLRQYWAERVSQGHFPDWYPYDALGQPFAGMVISGAFHPANLLTLVFPLGTGLKLNILLCYPTAFGGTYLLAKRWGLAPIFAALAGLSFCFTGYMVSITNNLLYLMAAATLPWAMWSADRLFDSPSPRRLGLAALCLILVLLAGDSQAFAIDSALVLGLAVARHRPGRALREVALAASLMVLTAALGAAQITAAMHVFSQGKAGAQPKSDALTWSLHPLRLIEAAFGPIFRGNAATPVDQDIARNLLQEQMATLWVDSLYVGAPVLFFAVLAVWARRKSRPMWLACTCALGLFALALGKYASLYGLLFDLLPIWRPFRFPEKLVPQLLLLVALGAGLGFQVIEAQPRIRKAALWGLGALTLVSALVGGLESRGHALTRALAYFWSAPPMATAPLQVGSALSQAGWRSAVGAGLLLLVIAGVSHPRLRQALVLLVITAGLFVANEPYYDLSLPEVLLTPSSFVQTIRETEGPPQLGGYRVMSGVDGYSLPKLSELSFVDSYVAAVATALEPDTPAQWGLESANCYLPATSKRIYDLYNGGKLLWTRHASLFSARYITVNAGTFERIGGTANVVFREHRELALLLLKNPEVKRRAFLSRPRCVANAGESLEWMESARFAANTEPLIECTAPLPVVGPEVRALGRIKVVSYEPERVELSVEAYVDAVLVLADAYYSGWTARVDGVPREVLPADHALRAIPIHPADRSVVFEYRTPGRSASIAISLASLIGVFGLLWVGRRENRHPQ